MDFILIPGAWLRGLFSLLLWNGMIINENLPFFYTEDYVELSILKIKEYNTEKALKIKKKSVLTLYKLTGK